MSGDGKRVSDGMWRWTRVGGYVPTGFVPGEITPFSLQRRPLDMSRDGSWEFGEILDRSYFRPIQNYWESDAYFGQPPILIGNWINRVFEYRDAGLERARVLSGDGDWVVHVDSFIGLPGQPLRTHRDGRREAYPLPRIGNYMGNPTYDGMRVIIDNRIYHIPPSGTAADATLLEPPFLAGILNYGVTALSMNGDWVAGTAGYGEPILGRTTASSGDRFWGPYGATRPYVESIDVSDDGRMVLGRWNPLSDPQYTQTTGGRYWQFFVRRSGEQARRLETVLTRFGASNVLHFTIRHVKRMSVDGKTLVGYATSPWYGDSAFVATIPDWQPCPTDLNFDSTIDDADFVLFADAYNRLETADADFTFDGETDDSDFVIFASGYDALLCP